MKVYFVTNDKLYSKFFLWLFNTNTSHMGLGFNIGNLDFVVDANKPYGKHYLLQQWLLKYKIIVTVEIELAPEIEDRIYNTAINRIVNVPYDMVAYNYGAFRGFMKKFFNYPYPKTNAFSDPDKWCCTEIFAAIKDELASIGIDVTGLNFDALTPEMIEKEIRIRTANLPNVKWY